MAGFALAGLALAGFALVEFASGEVALVGSGLVVGCVGCVGCLGCVVDCCVGAGLCSDGREVRLVDEYESRCRSMSMLQLLDVSDTVLVIEDFDAGGLS